MEQFSRKISVSEEFLKKLDQLVLFIKKKFQGLEGKNPSSRKGGMVEFSDHKEYSHGDDFRYVDWNIYSRTDKLFIKQYSSEDQFTSYVFVDNSLSMNYGSANKLFLAKCIAIAFSYITLSTDNIVKILKSNHSLSFNTFTKITEVAKLIETFEKIEPAKEKKISAVLNDFSQKTSHKGLFILISDLLEEKELQKKISTLANLGFDVIIIHVLASEEINPNFYGRLTLKDVESEKRLPVFISKRYIENYQKKLADFLEGWRNFCNQHNIRYAFVNTSKKIEDVVFEIFINQRIFFVK